MMSRFIIILFLLPLALLANDGKQLYTTYCSACHGADGRGPENNVNPPLAKSEWLLGKPDRAISAVLVGLAGPIEVAGKAYHLIMPPQGAVLNDEQLAAILTYVRTSWGNEEEAVSAEQVAEVRERLKDRKTPYGANELREKYPIPYERGWPRLENLISHVYHGKWELMPDFSKLEVASVEEEPRNLVDVAHAERDQEFGIVWTGDLVTDREGDYRALLDASDGAILYVNGKKQLEVEGIGPRGSERARTYRFRLLKGRHQFRLEYFNNQGKPGLSFQVSGPSGKQWLSESRLKIIPAAPAIPLRAEEGKSAVIYRNFIEGAGARAIGVGYEEGVNQAFSVTHMGPDVIWQGKFLDGGLHWTNRGQGNQKPSGTDVVQLLTKPAYAILADENSAWPQKDDERVRPQFGGYSLDEKGRPTFRYRIGEIRVTEAFEPLLSETERSLKRLITFKSSGSAPENLYLALASGPEIERSGERSGEGFILDAKVTLKSDAELVLRRLPESQVLVPLALKNGLTQLSIYYTWKKP